MADIGIVTRNEDGSITIPVPPGVTSITILPELFAESA